MNHDSGFRAKSPHQHPEIAWSKSDAPGRRREARPRDVDEYRATTSGNSWAGVVIDFNDDVVEAVLPPKPVAWFTGRPLEGSIITAVAWILTPRIGRVDAADRKLGQRTRKA